VIERPTEREPSEHDHCDEHEDTRHRDDGATSAVDDATATKPEAVAASTTIASCRRPRVRVIAYHAAASATTISGSSTARRRRSVGALAIVARTTTAATRMAPAAATRCDIPGRVPGE
jgi:hypothetical protein